MAQHFFISKSSEILQLITETFKAYGIVKQYGADKLGSFIPRVDPVLEYADKTVDYYMPPDESDKKDEGKDNLGENLKTRDRVVAISSKVRQRMFIRAMNQVKSVKKRSQDAVDRFTHTVNLIEYAKAFDGKLRYMWNEIQKNEEETEKDSEKESVSKVKVIENRVIVTCRQIRKTVNNFTPGQYVPSYIFMPFEKTKKITDDLVLSYLKVSLSLRHFFFHSWLKNYF